MGPKGNSGAVATVTLKPRPHQQQCRSNIVERYKSNDSFDKVECCFDIVAIFGNNVVCFGNDVERNFVLSTKSKQTEHKPTTLLQQCRSNIRLWQHSRMLRRHCCWCGPGFMHWRPALLTLVLWVLWSYVLLHYPCVNRWYSTFVFCTSVTISILWFGVCIWSLVFFNIVLITTIHLSLTTS